MRQDLGVADPHDAPVPPANIVIDEPPPLGRVRRPFDLIQALLGAIVTIIVVFIGSVTVSAVSGLQEDVAGAATRLSGPGLQVASALAALAGLALPVAAAVDLLGHRQLRRFADTVAAGAAAVGVCALFNRWVDDVAPTPVRSALTALRTVDHRTEPTLPLLAGLLAVLLVSALARRQYWRGFGWGAVVAFSGLNLVTGDGTPLAVAVTLLIGATVGIAVRYTLGIPSTRPSAAAVAGALQRAGVTPVAIRPATAADDGHRYLMSTAEGPVLDVKVMDRDQQGVGLFYRAYRSLRVRGPAQRQAPFSLNRAVEREALAAYASGASGVATPRLAAVTHVGPDAAALAYQYIEGRRLSELAPEEITDDLLLKVWQQAADLHAHRLTHRALTADNVLIDARGEVWLIDLARGDLAASDLQTRLDEVQLLVTTTLLVGTERAARIAQEMVGESGISAAVPLLQPLVLSRETRAALRERPTLLSELRERLLSVLPDAVVPPVRIERFRPRTVITIVLGAVAAYLLLGQLAKVHLARLAEHTDWRWAVVAVVLSSVTYLGAALNLTGFTTTRLRFGRTLLAQLAGSFVKLVAPAAVGGAALNVRYLQRAGTDLPVAVAAVAASQVAGFVVTLSLLAIGGLITGTSRGAIPAVPFPVLLLAAVAATLLLVALAIRPSRKFLLSRIQPTARRVLPTLLDTLQRPTRLLMGFGGSLIITLGFVLTLDASVRAFGGHLSILTIAIVFLAGSALGSAVPTPGGLGAVEGALYAGLVAAGLAGETALSAVLVYRLCTFWLPAPIGWGAFAVLQRKRAI